MLKKMVVFIASLSFLVAALSSCATQEKEPFSDSQIDNSSIDNSEENSSLFCREGNNNISTNNTLSSSTNISDEPKKTPAAAKIPDMLTENKTSIINTKKNSTVPDDEDEGPEDRTDELKVPKNKLLMFHNGRGPMCLEQLDFLDKADKCQELEIVEYLTTQDSTYSIMKQYQRKFSESQGYSDSFRYLPITFINEHAYSGFDDDVKEMLEDDIDEICG